MSHAEDGYKARDESFERLETAVLKATSKEAVSGNYTARNKITTLKHHEMAYNPESSGIVTFVDGGDR